MEIRPLAAGRGLGWITDSWQYFAKAPAVWVGITVLLGLITIVISVIPGMGIVISLFTPVLSGGLLLGCAEQAQDRPLRLSQLFAGFKQPQLWTLILAGLLAQLAYILIAAAFVVVLFLSTGMTVFSAEGGVPQEVGLLSIAILSLCAMLLMVPVVMAVWFAPALIVFERLSALEALKQSFVGCLRNMLPFLIYGICLLLLFFIAAIPLGLGFLIVFPMIVVSVYIGYRDIFASTAVPR